MITMSTQDPAAHATPKKQSLAKRDRSIRLHLPPADRLDLSGRHLVVVGGTNGLGRAIAVQAVARGAHVSVVGRTLRDDSSGHLDFYPADLSSMREAIRIGKELPVEDSDVLLFTTGIIAAKTREQTPEGVERDMAISFLSRLAIMTQVAGRLGTQRADQTARPRIFVMGSPGWGDLGTISDLNNQGDYTSMKAHGNSIAGNEALVVAGQRRFPGPAYFGLAPGLVKTGIRSNLLGDGSAVHKMTEGLVGLFLQSATTYGKRMLPLLFTPELDSHDGVMFNSKGRPILPTRGFDTAYAERFLNASDELLRHALKADLAH
jgi:NAD(P)-dependent dehydrogenase (short-subunit alcohol dehydrogenase family)